MDTWVLEVMFTGLLAFVPDYDGCKLKRVDVHVLDATTPCRSESKDFTIPPHSAVVLYEPGELTLQWKARAEDKLWIDWPYMLPTFWDPAVKRKLALVSAHGYDLEWPTAPNHESLDGGLGLKDKGARVMSMTELITPDNERNAYYEKAAKHAPEKNQCGSNEPAADTSLTWGEIFPSAGNEMFRFCEPEAVNCLKDKDGSDRVFQMAEEVTLRMAGLPSKAETSVALVAKPKCQHAYRPAWRLYRDPNKKGASSRVLVWLKNLPLHASMAIPGAHTHDMTSGADSHFEWFYRFTHKGPGRWRIPTPLETASRHDMATAAAEAAEPPVLGEGLHELNPRCPFSQYP